jgi:CBS domain-containing protein
LISQLSSVEHVHVAKVVELRGRPQFSLPSQATCHKYGAARMTTKPRTVADIMTRSIVSVSPSTSREQVLDAIVRHRIGGVAVVDHSRLVGVISKGDLLARTGITARDLMTPVVHSIPPNLPVRAAASRMLTMNIQRLLVVDEGVPVGVVTATDFLRDLLGAESRSH